MLRAALLWVLGDLFPRNFRGAVEYSMLLPVRISLNEVIDNCALLFGEWDPACDLGEAEFLNVDDELPCPERLLNTSRKTANKPMVIEQEWNSI